MRVHADRRMVQRHDQLLGRVRGLEFLRQPVGLHRLKVPAGGDVGVQADDRDRQGRVGQRPVAPRLSLGVALKLKLSVGGRSARRGGAQVRYERVQRGAGRVVSRVAIVVAGNPDERAEHVAVGFVDLREPLGSVAVVIHPISKVVDERWLSSRGLLHRHRHTVLRLAVHDPAGVADHEERQRVHRGDP